MKEIQLTQGYVAMVDDEDYEFVANFKWQAKIRPHSVYAQTKITLYNGNRKTVAMHRLIKFCPSNFDIDHINRNGLDNRNSNLRICTRAQNMWNTHFIHGVSKYKGVTWDSAAKKWRAAIKHNGITKNLGVFLSETDAANCYDKAALSVFGEYARINTYEAE